MQMPAAVPIINKYPSYATKYDKFSCCVLEQGTQRTAFECRLTIQAVGLDKQ